MSGDWVDVPINAKLYQNTSETELTRAQAAMENCFITESDGIRRFYGIESWVQLPDEGNVHGLHDDGRENLIAATTTGNLFRIDRNGVAENVTDVQLAGGRRPIFSKTTDGLTAAAGGPVIHLGDAKTKVLSDDAPKAVTHIQFIDNYAVVNDDSTFAHSGANVLREWDALDTFAASFRPDPVNALLASPFGELFVCGVDSTEQYERLQNGETPFFRRWAVGEGLSAPYALLHADNALFLVNKKREVVRSSGQTSQPVSVDIGSVLEHPGLDWRDAWIGGFPDVPLHFDGQKFILLQLPRAANPYGGEGLTYIYDYRQKRWFTLYGWGNELGQPARWPGLSHWSLWDQVFIGGPLGKIGKLSKTTFTNFGDTQRLLLRTAHMSALGEVEMNDVRLRVLRGTGSNTTEATLSLRCRRENKTWGRWNRKSLGRAGDRSMMLHFGRMGSAHAFQFEIMVTDNCPVEIHKMQAQVVQTGHG